MAKELQRYWTTFHDSGKLHNEVTLTTTAETRSLPANTMQLRFKRPGMFTDGDKLLRMFATVCPMIFGTLIAVLREEYVNPWNDLKGGRDGPPSHVSALARELERIWEAWVRILKNMPAEIGETKRDDSWKAEKAQASRALSGRSGTADNIGGVVSY